MGNALRVLPTAVHGVFDYLVAVLLLVTPWVLGFASGGAETWAPVMLGTATIVYSLVTDYEAGVWRRLAMPGHLALDLMAGVLLGLSPWLFGFADEIFWPHLLVGAVEVVVSLVTRTVPEFTGE